MKLKVGDVLINCGGKWLWEKITITQVNSDSIDYIKFGETQYQVNDQLIEDIKDKYRLMTKLDRLL